MSHLQTEKSPYLLQHVDNPVDWYPWSDQAFARARNENRLVFLSVGYSTCHWCHVMAHECFEDDEVAGLLNADYISIKVDREERPDIDQVYMDVCQRMTGSGGWPLTIIMTPDARPFYAATYIPKHGHQGRPGLMQLLPWLAAKWREEPEFIVEAAEEIVKDIQKVRSHHRHTPFNLQLQEQAETALKKSFDSRFGGFGRAPKFPRPHDLTFLLQRARQNANKQILDMVDKTLVQMRNGGLYDHLGSGFHRYSTDERWLVPHFEKMLYDQAGLVEAYLEGWQILGKPLYAETARAVLDYLLRDMRAAGGAFYSAEDADSEGEEGTFYLWSKQAIKDVLGENADAFCASYHVKEQGNYHDEATGRLTGTNILYLSADDDSGLVAHENDRKLLFDARAQRIRPHLDDKVLAGWNGMTITAFARVGKAFSEDRYLQAAKEAADFVLSRMTDKDGRLLRRFREEDAAIPAFSEDYACLARGLLELYGCDFNLTWLQKALDLAQFLIDFFQDQETGVLYDTPIDGEKLLVRPHSTFDGAFPSPGSIALEVFAKLYLISGNNEWRLAAEKLMQSLSAEVSRYPAGYTRLLQSSNWLLRPTREIVIVDGDGSTAMLEMVQKTMGTQTVILHKTAENSSALARLAPYTADMSAVEGKTTAYVCQDFSCLQPITDQSRLQEALNASP